VISGARQNLNARESGTEEFVTEFQDIFATKSGECERRDRVYHCIDTGDVRLIRQPPRKTPLTKQTEVSEMLTDMK
jgi:hypothetical protein